MLPREAFFRFRVTQRHRPSSLPSPPRFLELVFSLYDLLPYDDHAAVLDWRTTLHWIRDTINAPAPTIHFVMADPFFVAVCRHRRALTKRRESRLWRG